MRSVSFKREVEGERLGRLVYEISYGTDASLCYESEREMYKSEN